VPAPWPPCPPPSPQRRSHGTCKLPGPKVKGNLEGHDTHVVVSHIAAPVFPDTPRSFAGLAALLARRDAEGLVLHRSDGRMAQTKLRVFGLKRPGNIKAKERQRRPVAADGFEPPTKRL